MHSNTHVRIYNTHSHIHHTHPNLILLPDSGHPEQCVNSSTWNRTLKKHKRRPSTVTSFQKQSETSNTSHKAFLNCLPLPKHWPFKASAREMVSTNVSRVPFSRICIFLSPLFYRLGGKHLPSTCKALGSLPSTGVGIQRGNNK